MNEKTLYFAYGSNLNLDQMARRCPDAEPVGRVRLDGYRLAFRRTGGGYLTILPDKGNHVDGLLWKVSAQDEQALNHYEGFPHFYARRTVDVQGKGVGHQAMVYVMNAPYKDEPERPSRYYWNTVLEGCRQNGIPIQYDSDGKPTLCADCRDLPARLDKALWSVRQAAILTSGTLSAGGNFTHTVQRIGLNNPQTFRAESPFDYKRNCILYFPKRTSTPLDEVEWLSQEIEQLVQVCHGHALVLFTSYDQVGRVQQRLQGLLAYPLLTARRNGQLFVQAFKQLPNAVLFAAGPCWEGVDFPGDRVSLLIIARLPFPVPDPVSDAEKAKYPDLHSYIQAEVIPTMQKKLRQGFGRAIRTETDTCTVAILDPRAAPGGRYHRAALDALPKMNMTQDIKDVEHFIRAVKGAEYFFA